MDLLNIKEKFFLTHCDVPYLGFICIEWLIWEIH
jgi:hypothetical protein